MTGSRRPAARVAAWLCFVLGLVVTQTIRADPGETRRLVIVLRPNPGAVQTWPEGTQAVVAELVAGGYELMLRASVARDYDGLLAELHAVASERPVLGAVVVWREGDRGIAYVYTHESGTVPVESEISDGAVGEGALALRITQVLGPPRFDVPSPRPAAPPPPAPAPAPSPAPPPVAREETPRAFLVALAVGLGFTSDLPEPLPMVGLTLRRHIVGPLSFEAAGAVSLGTSRLEARGGNVDVSTEQLTLHLAFEPFRGENVGLSLGLGGGVVWVEGEGDAREGFSGTNDATRVALLSTRATASFTHNDWSLLLGVEPGVMLPAVSVGTGSGAARLGRPWTTASAGLGWNF